jgi:hypothetical protein
LRTLIGSAKILGFALWRAAEQQRVHGVQQHEVVEKQVRVQVPGQLGDEFRGPVAVYINIASSWVETN